MEATTQDNLLISYREDLDVLFVRWNTSVSSSKFRAGYKQVLKEAEQAQARFWLYDLRSRGAASPADEAWYFNEFFPLVEAKIGNNISFAYLVSPSHFPYIRDHIGLKKLSSYGSPTSIQIFVSEGEALKWLTQRQRTWQKSA
jgi:hypothetical protein